MTQKRDFDPDIDGLPIAKKAKRVLETFLDTECSPGATLSPKQAKRRRQQIIEITRSVAEGAIAYEGQAAATVSLYTGLMEASTAERWFRHTGFAIQLADLANSFKAVATHKRSRNTRE